MKKIERYIAIHNNDREYIDTLNFGLHLYSFPITTLLSYTDVDWGGYSDICRFVCLLYLSW